VASTRLHAGDLLTLARVAATPLFVWAFAGGVRGDGERGLLAGVTFALVAASDYFDGPLARRAGRASERGRRWDSWADIVFLETALVAAVALGLTPWWVPASIAASFGWYVIDSWWRTRDTRRPALVASRLGHFGGVCNYVLVGVLTYDQALRLDVLGPEVLSLLYLLVPLYSGAAIAARLRGLPPGP
jgi:CDP-diacylglycerol--glycerol-3-phosphate 3-phosphatidyltransferase